MRPSAATRRGWWRSTTGSSGSSRADWRTRCRSCGPSTRTRWSSTRRSWRRPTPPRCCPRPPPHPPPRLPQPPPGLDGATTTATGSALTLCSPPEAGQRQAVGGEEQQPGGRRARGAAAVPHPHRQPVRPAEPAAEAGAPAALPGTERSAGGRGTTQYALGSQPDWGAWDSESVTWSGLCDLHSTEPWFYLFFFF